MGYVRYPDREGRDDRIRELGARGLSCRAIAAIVGCGHHLVWEVLNPEAKRRNMAQRKARNTSTEGLKRQRDYRRRRAK